MSITPKQAYEAAKVLWPDATKVQKRSDMTSMFCQNGRVSLIIDAKIDWGDTDQYPPPEPEWVDAVFPDDVGKQGRVSNNREAWYEGMIRGRNEGGYWMVRNTTWKLCQVRKVKT
jgi:hypothetical protein